MKKACPLLLALLTAVLFLLTGCTEGEAAQLREGRRLMRAYLAEHGIKAGLSDSHADVLRPDASVLVLSDYVWGSFRQDGEKYDLAVNVVTGEIYTSERMEEFTRYCVAALTERLELDPSNCVGYCWIFLEVPTWHNGNPDWPANEYRSFRDMLPADIADMEAYAVQAVTSEEIELWAELVCRNEELSEERWSLADTKGWDNTSVTVYALDEPGAELPNPKEFFYRDKHDFSGTVVRLEEQEVSYQRVSP